LWRKLTDIFGRGKGKKSRRRKIKLTPANFIKIVIFKMSGMTENLNRSGIVGRTGT